MLISNPVVWVLMGIILTVAYKMVVEPLFYLAKGYINGKRASKKEKSKEAEIKLQELQKQPEKNQERPKTPDRDSGVIISEIAIDNNSFLHKTEKEKNYNYKLTTTDIRDIVEAHYGWTAYKDRKGLKNAPEGVIFACPDSTSLEQELKEYKNKVEREGSDLVFTSILNLNGNHWVTLVISHDEKSEKFRAYYCDSFGELLPEKLSSALQKTLGVDNSSIESSKIKQQKDEDKWNCGVFALENAKKVTDMLRESKSFDEIDDQLKYELSSEQLIEKRKEFAKALEKDEQSIASTPGNRSRRNSSASLDDSGLGVEAGEFHENLDTLVHQTNRKNYAYWLQQHDIAHIARIKYKYSEGFTDGVFFCIPGNLDSLNERLKEYKNKAEQENLKVTFTSVVNLGNLHWTTLVVAYNPDDKQFSAYYCDSFSAKLPSPGSKRSSIKLANEIKDKLFTPLTNQASELNAQGKKEMGQDVRKTAQTCRDKKNELINVPINTDNIVSALEAVLEIENCNIRSSGARQQSDGHNCGIFALENARRVTQMLNEGKSFDEIDKKLSEYKFDLNGKRREFAKVLMEDKEWRENLENELLCDLSPRTKTSSTSEVQHTGSFCNIT